MKCQIILIFDWMFISLTKLFDSVKYYDRKDLTGFFDISSSNNNANSLNKWYLKHKIYKPNGYRLRLIRLKKF